MAGALETERRNVGIEGEIAARAQSCFSWHPCSRRNLLAVQFSLLSTQLHYCTVLQFSSGETECLPLWYVVYRKWVLLTLLVGAIR